MSADASPEGRAPREVAGAPAREADEGASAVPAAGAAPAHDAQAPPHAELPPADRVLAVCAHPDDETFGLGGLLGTYAELGCEVGLLCLTRGEASGLGGGDLARLRERELYAAADRLGLAWVVQRAHPDGGLADRPLGALVDDVDDCLLAQPPDVVLTFHPGGITGHPDHRAATAAARVAALRRAVPTWSWYLPQPAVDVLAAELDVELVGAGPGAGDRRVTVDRRRQRAAMACHASQADDAPVVERMLAFLGDVEHLTPLVPEPLRPNRADR